MRYGALFPGDSFSFRYSIDDVDEWVAAVGEAGFDHVVFGDHVIGVEPTGATPGWDAQWPNRERGIPAYTHANVFREPLVLLAYLAGRCDLELMTGVLILPQRQTVLVAKQAAEIDQMSRGRLRLGVGVGWNAMEYDVLGTDFATRGRRIEEQIQLLRRLWNGDIVTFDGEFDQVRSSSIMATPTHTIPIWMGGNSARALDRVGRMGDGWFALSLTNPEMSVPLFERIRKVATEHGRDADQIGFEALFKTAGFAPDELTDRAQAWRRAGVTHLAVDTRQADATSLEPYLEAVARAGATLLG
jgi:probable F420-dependent oxidoreductase